MVVGFERRLYTVGEEDRQVELCVTITLPRRQDIGTVNFSLIVETHDGSAGISCKMLSILTGLVVEGYTQPMYEYPYVMYNLATPVLHAHFRLHMYAWYLLQPTAKRVF